MLNLGLKSQLPRVIGGLVLLVSALGLSFAEAQTLRERLQERVAARRSDVQANLQEATILHDGLKRKYIVHVPRRVGSDGQPAAVVLAFHGGGGDASHMADSSHYGLVAKADAAGFIVLFPNGYSKLPNGKFATWNAGNCCGDARDRSVDDVGFIRALLRQLAAKYRIDPQRIYAAGMSNGGMMAHRLACDAADVIAAVASVAGTDNTKQCKPSRPISVLHIHAKDDTHVLFEGGAGKDAFRDVEKVTEFTSVPQTIARWSQRNRCEAQTARTLDVAGAFCEVQACAAHAQVQLCVTAVGAHSWPGAEATRAGKESPSQALEANDVIWDFFKAIRLPG